MDKKIIIILGRVASGKDTFAATLINHTQIDIGSIVREIKQQEQRVFDKDLDDEIMYQLKEKLKDNPTTNFVITGIRQKGILQYLIVNCEAHFIEYECIYLEVPDEELKRRFICRQNFKDIGLSFEEVIERDGELGLNEIEKYIKENQELFTIIKNY